MNGFAAGSVRSNRNSQRAPAPTLNSIAQTKLPRRLHAARIGLFTVARLLADSEPFRLRWALQHWPYPIVKLTRSLMSDASSRTPVILRGEAQVLKSAWERLTLEGRLE